jgi:murein L,D-transpeptidase YcbB/YkuD
LTLAAGVFTPYKHSREARRSRRLKRLALLLLGFATAFAVLAALAAFVTTLADGPARQLRADIERQVGSGAYPQEVAQFYAGRDFQPLWIEASGAGPWRRRLALRPEARRVASLAQAAHQPSARAALQALAAAASRRPEALARAELATSAALGAYVRSLAPEGPEPLAFIDPDLARPADTGAVLYQAVRAPTVASYVAAVAEVNPVYRDLQAGLSRYRATWSRLPQTPIAPGPDLGEGAAGPRVDALRERLGLAAKAAPGAPFDAGLAAAVRRFQEAHGLPATGRLDAATLGALNAGAAHYEALIAANLNRARALPPVVGGRFVLVNVAARELEVYEAGRPVHAMRVIVGGRQEQTPMMAGLLRYLVFNPYWNVPVDIVRTSIAPHVLAEGPGYLRRARMQVLSDWDDMPVEVDPRTVDWEGVSRGWQELRVRQLPGGDNMMGRMKFMAPNELGIYLHDTPNKAAFQSSDRLLSAGCVRLEAPEALAAWLLGGGLPDPSSLGVDREAYLPAPVPLYITYLTAAPGTRGVVFHPDVYGKDAPPQPQAAAS